MWKWSQIQKFIMNDSCLEKCCFMQHVYIGTPHFIILHFIAFHRYYMFVCLFFKTEGLWQPCIKQVYQCHFPNICSLCASVSWFLAIFAIFQTFLLIFVMVICNQ